MWSRCAVLGLLASGVVGGQDLSVIEDEIKRFVTEHAIEDARDDLIADLRDNMSKVLLFNRPAEGAAAQLLRFRRADVQSGSSGGAAGSTSAVLSPLIPASFGLALESGSITRSIRGTTATVKINPAGLFCATGPEAEETMLRGGNCLDVWRRVGVSLSFDTSRSEVPAEAPAVASVGEQFAEAAVRVELVNQRKPANKSFQKQLEKWRASAKGLVQSDVGIQTWLRTEGYYKALEDRLMALISEFTAAKLSDEEKTARVMEEIRAVVREVQEKLPPDMKPKLDQARELWLNTLKANDAVYNSFAHGWVVSAEYVFQRPGATAEPIGAVVAAGMRPPSLHTGRLILARGLAKRRLDFTLNASSSWFSELRPGVNRGLWRDAQFGGDAKFRLADVRGFGAPVLTVAGLFMHLHQPPLGFEIETFSEKKVNQPGSLGLIQFKFELPTANAAVRIPFSFTYSSRTELIDEADVRGQIGISLNFDSLFGQF